MAEENVRLDAAEAEDVEFDANVTETPESNGPTFGQKFASGLKERVRKFFASLKRKPQNIGFFVLIIASVIYMCSLINFSQATILLGVPFTGLLVFVNTMLSVLTLLLYMNTFPKRKKNINVIMLVMTFVFMAIMIFCDIFWYTKCAPAFEAFKAKATDSQVFEQIADMDPAFPIDIVHIVFVGLSAVLLATLPLYKPLLMKINTSKDIGESQLSEEIDTSEEDG